MDPLLERLISPAIVWVFIPILAIFFWGITGVIRALRGEPQDFQEWKKELKQLRNRVDKLEEAQHGTHLGETSAHVPGPGH